MLYESKYYGICDLGPVLTHHGIKGQKWGVRRFQNLDRTWTAEGKIRYGGSGESKKSTMSELGMSWGPRNQSHEQRYAYYEKNKALLYSDAKTKGKYDLEFMERVQNEDWINDGKRTLSEYKKFLDNPHKYEATIDANDEIRAIKVRAANADRNKPKILTEESINQHYKKRFNALEQSGSVLDEYMNALSETDRSIKKLISEHDGDGTELINKVKERADNTYRTLSDAIDNEAFNIEQERRDLLREMHDKNGLSRQTRKKLVIDAVQAEEGHGDIPTWKLPNTTKQAKYFDQVLIREAAITNGKKVSNNSELRMAARDYAIELAGDKRKKKIKVTERGSSVRDGVWRDLVDRHTVPLDEAVYLALMRQALRGGR